MTSDYLTTNSMPLYFHSVKMSVTLMDILRSHGLSISSPTTIQKWKERYIDNDELAPFPQTSPFITPNTNDSVPNNNWGVGWSYPGVS